METERHVTEPVALVARVSLPEIVTATETYWMRVVYVVEMAFLLDTPTVVHVKIRSPQVKCMYQKEFYTSLEQMQQM